ncbi:MAG: phosphocholine cytidylyltransferase family protein [Kofleriaceae bacterium]|nr:phosphocholine cytidylyltransferase family protein [Kofleriaceae bacterium]MCB9572394.1 phosphocholine cytidylyltransferase family protein [Kofleriaceae bacterium]
MSARPRKVIVIAAGRGKRLGVHTDERPKCLVDVGARSILGWQVEALRAAGVDDLVMIRGYRPDELAAGARALWPGARFVENPAWQTNNILLSLACARDELDGPVYLTYSDIIFTPAVARALADAEGDVALVIDRRFRDIYEGRTEHPLEEGEVSDLDDRGRVRRVGKRALPAGDAHGEFIGLLKLSAEGTRWVRDGIDALLARYAGREDEPFQRAARFRNAYLTDLLQELIDAGRDVVPVTIDGQWREIDTNQDLERAVALVESGLADWSAS